MRDDIKTDTVLQDLTLSLTTILIIDGWDAVMDESDVFEKDARRVRCWARSKYTVLGYVVSYWIEIEAKARPWTGRRMKVASIGADGAAVVYVDADKLLAKIAEVTG